MTAELRHLIDQLGEYELESDEGVRYAPRINVELDENGEVMRLEVGLKVTTPELWDEETSDYDHEEHDLWLVPSTATREGVGTGNVFFYEDGEAITHVAWGKPADE